MSPVIRWYHYYVLTKQHPTNPGFSKVPLCRWMQFSEVTKLDEPGVWHPTMTGRVVRKGDEVAPCYNCLEAVTNIDEIKTLKALEDME